MSNHDAVAHNNKIDQWIRRAFGIQNPKNAVSIDKLRTISSSIVVRSRKLAEQGPMSGPAILDFLFKVTLRWLERGMAPEGIVKMLPDDLATLGIIKMAEDRDEVVARMGGGKLTANDLKGIIGGH